MNTGDFSDSFLKNLKEVNRTLTSLNQTSPIGGATLATDTNGDWKQKKLDKFSNAFEILKKTIKEMDKDVPFQIDPESDIDKIATEVIRGNFGNGEERKRRMKELGYNYHAVQNYVNKKIRGGLTQADADVSVWLDEAPEVTVPNTAAGPR